MGDIADWTNDTMQEAYPDWSPVGDPYRSRRAAARTLRCAHCGATGLNWQQIKGSKWRLHEGRLPHVCKTSADGFEDEPT